MLLRVGARIRLAKRSTGHPDGQAARTVTKWKAASRAALIDAHGVRDIFSLGARGVTNEVNCNKSVCFKL